LAEAEAATPMIARRWVLAFDREKGRSHRDDGGTHPLPA
jgi:hypothetical protein